MNPNKHKRKKLRKYTVLHLDVELDKKETKEFNYLLEARKVAMQLKLQGRFLSLTNINGVTLCL